MDTFKYCKSLNVKYCVGSTVSASEFHKYQCATHPTTTTDCPKKAPAAPPMTIYPVPIKNIPTMPAGWSPPMPNVPVQTPVNTPSTHSTTTTTTPTNTSSLPPCTP